MSRTRSVERIRAALVVVALSIAASSTLGACANCGRSELAELTSRQGAVERDFSAAQDAWQNAKQGAVFGLGDGLRTGKAARAELALRPSGRALVEEHTILRFLNQKPEDGVELMQVEEGTVEIDSAAVEITLRIGQEVAHISRKSRVRVRAASADEASLDVIVGRVQIEREVASEDGAAPRTSLQTVLAGDSISLGIVNHVNGANEPAQEDERSSDTKAKQATSANRDDALDVEAESATVAPRVSEPADVTLLRLERATFHVAKPPLRLAIPRGTCSEELKVRVTARGRPRTLSAGKDRAELGLELAAGSHKLVVHCGKKQLAATSVRVVRDAGTLELPRSAPTIDVAADGRRYTVKYQNLLPTVSFTWPNPPPGPYTLRVVRKGKPPLTRSSSMPRVKFSSGELSEGEHTFSFQSAGQSAKPTVVRIAFDDSARVGFLASPSEGAASTGTVNVSGGSLHRAEVSIAGQQLTLDSHGRFNATIPHAPQQTAVAIRMSHPSTGVHYYVRRLDAAIR